jgi:hypothetical protein
MRSRAGYLLLRSEALRHHPAAPFHDREDLGA